MQSKQTQNPNSYSVIPHTIQELRIPCGRFEIVGDLILPKTPGKHPVIVLVWGSGPMTRSILGRSSPQVTRFLEAGYGLFVHDKPGYGASTGEFSRDHLLSERAGILTDVLYFIRSHVDVQADWVGVYGVSQAGYVLALALASGTPIDFMIAAACAVSDSIDQSGYLIEQQVLDAGSTHSDAALARRMYGQRIRATSYTEYREAAEYLDAIPVVRDGLGWGGILSEENFAPHAEDWDGFYDPGAVIGSLDMPVLALFAEYDAQVNPSQGMDIYSGARDRSGHPMFRVQLIHGADHIMRATDTGSLREQNARYAKPGSACYADEYLDSLSAWLHELKEWRLRNPTS